MDSYFQRVPSTWFSELLPGLLFLKSNQPKIIDIPKSHILEWQTLLPSQAGSHLILSQRQALAALQ